MIVTVLLGLTGLIVILSFFVLWTLAIIKLVRGRPLLNFEPRRPVPWGLADLFLVVILLLLAANLSVFLLRGHFDRPAGAEPQPLTLEQSMLAILADSGLKIVTMLIATPLIMLRNGCTWRDLGVVPSQAGKDIAIGLAAFCMLAPIVFAIQGLLTQIEPYKHPLIEMVTKSPDVLLFALLCFSAAIMAPLFEEWAFRVLLQGWLEKLVTYRGSFLHVLLGGVAPAEPLIIDEASVLPAEAAPSTSPDGITFLPNPLPQQAEIQWVDPTNPYAPPAIASVATSSSVDLVPEFSAPPLWKQWIPILLSALIFALMHFSHGLAWIPLAVLALGLGYVYQRTHRLLPSMVIHFCLNALSTAAVWVQMFEAPHLQK